MRLDGHVVHVMAVRLIHVLHKRATGCHVDDLRAAANREQRHSAIDRPIGQADVGRVLKVVHSVDLIALRLLPVGARVDVATTRQQDTLESGEAFIPV